VLGGGRDTVAANACAVTRNDDEVMRSEPVVLGHVAGVSGVRGWVKVHSYTKPREGLLNYRECLLGSGGEWRPARFVEGRVQGKNMVMRLEGIADRDAAGALIGLDIAVNRERLPELEEGHYYWADLEGLEVRQTSGTRLGQVERLLETGANDVLIVAGEREVLIPFVMDEVIKSVDLATGVIVVDWEWD